jgi:hypothetical protein
VLFVPFDRLGSERTPVEGTGLGLPLTKRLTEAMGGALGVASAIGQGSTFWIELPLTDGPIERLQRAEAPPEQHQPARERPPLRVLYIEDNLSNLQLVEDVLGRRPSVDLILLDLDLPDMPGEEVLRCGPGRQDRHNPLDRLVFFIEVTVVDLGFTIWLSHGHHPLPQVEHLFMACDRHLRGCRYLPEGLPPQSP